MAELNEILINYGYWGMLIAAFLAGKLSYRSAVRPSW